MTGEPSPPTVIHGTAVAIAGRAVVLTGRPGCGKSDLALRLIADGASLIADDAVVVNPSDEPQTGRIHASALPNAHGRLMVGRIGAVKCVTSGIPTLVALVVNLDDAASRRRSETTFSVAEILPGRPVPQVLLDPWETSAVIKVKLALERWGL